jgi:hypothetical protein
MTPAAQSKSLKDRLLQEAARDRERAETLPPGAERDALKKKARQSETAAHIDEWLSSPGLQPPKQALPQLAASPGVSGRSLLRSMQFRHLAEAERHIALGAQHISSQELRIADLELHGHNSTLARSLLETFRLTQAQNIAHRDQILRELGQ